MDQCKHCAVRGDIAACTTTPCGYHELWMVGELKKRNAELCAAINYALEAATLGMAENALNKAVGRTK